MLTFVMLPTAGGILGPQVDIDLALPKKYPSLGSRKMDDLPGIKWTQVSQAEVRESISLYLIYTETVFIAQH